MGYGDVMLVLTAVAASALLGWASQSAGLVEGLPYSLAVLVSVTTGVYALNLLRDAGVHRAQQFVLAFIAALAVGLPAYLFLAITL